MIVPVNGDREIQLITITKHEFETIKRNET
jgi:hypothetical protein